MSISGRALFIAGVLAIGWLSVALGALAAVPAARVERVSPTGRVEGVLRVEARFSEPMVSFAVPRGPQPFAIDCPVPGSGRWVDPETWVYGFESQVPAGIACRLRLEQGLRSLAGHPVEGGPEFAFDTGGPRVLETFPHGGEPIDERQIFLLTLAAEADPDSIREHARCAVAGESTPRRVELLTGPRRTDLLARLGREDELRVVMLQCSGDLPADRELVLSWGAGIRTPGGMAMDLDQSLAFRVRPLFFLQTGCEDPDEPTDRCNPEWRIGVRFSVPVAPAQAAGFRLRGPWLVSGPLPLDADTTIPVDAVWFGGPFPEQVSLMVEIPPGLVDASGRPLSDAVDSRLSATTGQVPRSPSLEFPAGDILESRAGAVLPVLWRDLEGDLEGDLRGRWLRLGPGSGGARPDPEREDRELLDWLGRVKQWRTAEPGTRPAVLAADAPAESFSIQVPRGRGQSVAGIDLPGPGFYVVELAAPGPGAADPTVASVLVTDLAVHVKTGSEGPWLVWVTGLDEARPVADAQVALADACTGARFGQGRTDPDGIARIAARWPSRSAETRCPLRDWVLVSARTADDLSFALVEGWGSRSDPPAILHTVFDRTLLKPGETLSMKHVLRRPVMDGFAIPRDGPKTLKIEHRGSGASYELPLRWDPQGIAESTWIIPSDAHLGPYQTSVDDASVESAWDRGEQGFEVAEFRTPSMTARIDPPPGPLLGGDEPSLDLTVAYLDGAPAAAWPVRLSTRVEEPDFWPEPEPSLKVPESFADYDFDGSDVDDPATALCRPEDDLGPAAPMDVMLSAEGRARVSLPRLPRVCEPQVLVAVLDYQDANGERLSATRRLPLWPAQGRLGLRVAPRTPGDPLRLAVAALSPDGRPAAGQTIVVDLLRRKDTAHREILGNGLYRDRSETRLEGLGTVCTGQTDRQGVLRCEPRLAPIGEAEGLILRVSARDSQGRIAVVTPDLGRAWRGMEIPWDGLDLSALRLSARGPFEQGVVERIERMSRKIAGAFGGALVLETADGRTDYAPGQTARLAVRMPFPTATALVTVEREGVLRAFVARLAGDRPTLDLPIEARYAPEVKVSVLAVRGRQSDAAAPTGQSDPGKPVSVRGELELRVDPSLYRLEVAVLPAGEVHPVRAPVPVRIAVRRADGKPLPPGGEVAVAAVDESLLELLPNDSWALLDRMLTGRFNAVETAVAIDRVVGLRRLGPLSGPAGPYSAAFFQRLSDRIDRMYSKIMMRGPGDGSEPVGVVRTRFDTLLLWRGRVGLDARGEASIEVPLNDSLSRFRIVAVATAGAGHFGTGQAWIRTAQDLMLFSGVPPLVRSGDRIEAVFTARNAASRPLELAASARVGSETGDLPALPQRHLHLAAGESREIAWTLEVPEGLRTLTWEAGLQEVGGPAQDRLRVEQQVQPVLSVRTYQATLGSLDQPFALEVARPADALPGQGGVAVALRTRLGDGADGIRDYMQGYPYGCLEQQVSVAVALRDRGRWDAILSRLGDYLDPQAHRGLLKFFPGDGPGSEVLTAYVLAIAQEAGWPLPEATRDRLVAGLTDFLKDPDPPTRGPSFADRTPRRLAVIEALSRHGEATPDLLADLGHRPEHWPTSALLDWIAILGRVEGIPDREAQRQNAERLLRARLTTQGSALIFASPQGGPLWWLMGSDDLDAVRAILTLLPEPQWRADLPRLMRGALSRQRQGHWDLTTANAWGRLALERFSEALERQPVTGSTQGQLGGETRTHRWTDTASLADWQFPWPEGPSRLTLTHLGQGQPWALVESRAAIPLKAPLFTGYRIARTLTPEEQRRPGQWSRGDIVRVRLELTAEADMGWVAVRDPVPAGATILGTGFGRDSPAPSAQAPRDLWPVFEERRFDGFQAYYDQVPAGRWTLEYRVRLNNAGDFALPPTRVEALYLPEMRGELPNAPISVWQ